MVSVLAPSNRVLEIDKAVPHDLADVRFLNRQFVRLVAVNKRFANCNFRSSTFDACYLRNCVFDSCDFTGCQFVGSNLHGTTFSGCKFDYATFERTFIDVDILETGCPGLENLQMRFARSLRLNYQQIGDAKAANRAMIVELAATRVHLRKAWKSGESYYRKKYSGFRRLTMFLAWGEFWLLDFLWGNGESPLKLVRTVAIFLGAIALVDLVQFRPPDSAHGYIESIVNAPQIFLGTVIPAGYPTEWLTAILLARLVALACLMAIIIKRFSRR